MKKILLLIFICLASLIAQAQSDSIKQSNNAKVDSLIQKAEHDRLSDSLKLVLLEEQLRILQPKENTQRNQLQAQMQKMRQKDSLNHIAQQNRIDSLKKNAVGTPILIGTDTLCSIYSNFGSFTPSERAEHNEERIMQIAKIFSMKRDSLFIVQENGTANIVYKDQILLSVNDVDAAWLDSDKMVLAEKYKNRMVTLIDKYQQSTSLMTILKQIGLCLLVILGQYLLIKGVNRLFRRWVDTKIKSKKDELFTGIKIRDFEVLNSEKQVNSLLFISKIVRYLVNLLQLYITIPILFSIFPITQRLAEVLFGWILSPITVITKGFVGYLPKLFMIIIIIVIMRYIVRFLGYLTKEIESGRLHIQGFYPDWAKATFNITRIFLYAFMLVMIFPLLPSSNTDIFKGVSVFIGVIFSLGSSSIIANMVAGMVLTYMRPFKVGDRIKIGDLVGDVMEKSPFVIRIRTPKNEIITVPNSNILSSSVVNYSFSATENGLILYTSVTIGYDVPWKQVHAMLEKAASRTLHVLQTPKPFVLQTSLDDFYVSYQLCVYTNEAALQASIYSELHQNIQDCFNEEEVEIMSPHYRANRNGNQITVPENYRH